MNRFLGLCGLVFALVLAGCAKPVPYDYTAFKQSKPKSILVLPPVNHSPDVKASYSLLSQVTYPLAESGYYVFPVAVVEETFKQNGLVTASDIHALSTAKLQQIFGADAALYLDVKEYGTSYIVINSETRVSADARLVDLRTGKLLWSGSATASSNEQQSNANGGIIGILVQAAVNQIAHTISDKGHDIAGVTSARLLAAGNSRGMLYGPRSLQYGKETY
ncbi:lipoprotein [Pectobacterium carotovorum subsp. carotovorum]|nr:lipoprotein [Pectobacterium carotovorum subsp. carotovorum]